MEVRFLEEQNIIEVEFDTDDMVSTTIEELEDELDGIGVSLFKDDLEKLFNDAVKTGKASMNLGEEKTQAKTTDKATGIDSVEEEYIEVENEGNTNANTVGNWLAQFVANGYKIQKAQVIRGQVVEEVEFKGDLLIRKQHLCGPQITLLKMIIDEMTSASSGCNGRVINSIDSFEEENTIYTKLLVEGNITLRYKLIRLETFNNSLKF